MAYDRNRDGETSESGTASPFLRAFAEAARETPPEPEISSRRLANRLVQRFNRRRPMAATDKGVPSEAPEFQAWRFCRMLTRRVGELHLHARFRKRGGS